MKCEAGGLRKTPSSLNQEKIDLHDSLFFMQKSDASKLKEK